MSRDEALNRLDQARIDLRHAREAAEGAQNPSDREYASRQAVTLALRVNDLEIRTWPRG